MSRVLISVLLCALFLTAGCGSTGRNGHDAGLSPDQVRPALARLPYRIALHQHESSGNTVFVGRATSRRGLHVDFGIAICGSSCFGSLPPIPGAQPGSATGATGWAYNGNGPAQVPGLSATEIRAREKMDGTIFAALCTAAHEITCV